MVLTLYIVTIVSKKEHKDAARMTFGIPCLNVSLTCFAFYFKIIMTLNVQHCSSVGREIFALKILHVQYHVDH